MTQFARLKHDYQRETWHYQPRTVLRTSPETFPFQAEPNGTTKGDPITWPESWMAYGRSLAPNNWAMHVAAMIFNSASKPNVGERLSSGGNVVELDKYEDMHWHVVSFQRGNNPPQTVDYDYRSKPQFIHKAVCVAGATGKLCNPAADVDSYYPVLGDPDLWVWEEEIELFPQIGMSIRPKWSVWQGLRIRKVPYGDVIGKLWPWPWTPAATLIGYDPRGSDVWAKVQTRDGTVGFVGVLVDGVEYTNWHMETQPPIPPK